MKGEKTKMVRSVLSVGLCVFLMSCSAIRKLGINSMAPTLNEVVGVGYKQTDIQFMKLALPANLIMIEGMLEMSPNNMVLLNILAQGYCGYALGFVEDDDPEWAKVLYIKGRDFAIRALKTNKKFRKALEKGERFEDAVSKINDEEYVPSLFWAGNCWGAWLNLSLTDPKALFDIPKVLALMKKVLELNDKFYYGGAHLFMATYYAGLPPMAGGGVDKALPEFEKVFQISENKFLLAHVFYAKYYAALIKDEELFDKTIDYVLNFDISKAPELALVNTISKEKAKRLKAEKERYF
jgi:tetratricopeptide (TPR) repeat protein